MPPRKVTLDTNVLISGFLFGGICEEILRFGFSRRFQIITSKPIIEEFTEKMNTKIRVKYKINSTLIERALEVYLTFSELIYTDAEPRKRYTVDKVDNLIIDTAILSSSEYLVTGDRKHLLEKIDLPPLIITAPADFIKLF